MASSSQQQAQAAQFGWSLAVINSDPELKKVFAQASSQNWTPDRFVAAVRDTNWFKKNSDTARQLAILQKSDPATYNQRIQQAMSSVTTMGGQLGASITSSQASEFAKDVVQFGWSQDQLKAALGAHVAANKQGDFTGDAATHEMQFKQYASDYGVSVAPATLNGWVRGATLGNVSDAQVQQYMIGLASSKYPALADRLKAGETMSQIADPYKQSYAKVLEVNPATIKLDDPLLQNALAGKDEKGQPATQSVWQFEQTLRQDPRWLKTQNAQDSTMQVAHKVLTDFGMMGA